MFCTQLGLTISAQTESKSSAFSPYRNAFLEIPQSVNALMYDYDGNTWYNTPGHFHNSEKSYLQGSFQSVNNGIANHISLQYDLAIDSANRNISFGAIINTVSDIPYTVQLKNDSGIVDYSRVSSFTNLHSAFQFHYAQAIPRTKNLFIGTTAQLLYFKYGNFANAIGLVIDAGISGNLDWANWQVSVHDITSSPVFWTYQFSEEDLQVFESTGNDLPKNGIDVGLPSIQADIHIPFEFAKLQKYKFQFNANLVYQFTQGLGALDTKAGSILPAVSLLTTYQEVFQFGIASGNVFKINDGFEFDQNNNEFIATNSTSYLFSPAASLGLTFSKFQLQYAIQNRFLPNGGAVLSNLISLSYQL